MKFVELLDTVPRHLKEAISYFELKKGEYLFKQGSRPVYVYILIEGKVKASHSSGNGQDFLMGVFYRNELFGELEVQTGTDIFATVECLEDSLFVRIPHVVYFELFKSMPEFAIQVNKQICWRNINASSRMIEHNFLPLEYHVAKYIISETEDMKNNVFELNKNDFALFLGTSLRSLNRILKQFQDEGLLQVERNKVHVLNKERLNFILSKNFR